MRSKWIGLFVLLMVLLLAGGSFSAQATPSFAAASNAPTANTQNASVSPAVGMEVLNAAGQVASVVASAVVLAQYATVTPQGSTSSSGGCGESNKCELPSRLTSATLNQP